MVCNCVTVTKNIVLHWNYLNTKKKQQHNFSHIKHTLSHTEALKVLHLLLHSYYLFGSHSLLLNYFHCFSQQNNNNRFSNITKNGPLNAMWELKNPLKNEIKAAPSSSSDDATKAAATKTRAHWPARRESYLDNFKDAAFNFIILVLVVLY